MLLKALTLCALLAVTAARITNGITFKDVKVSGYSVYAHKFDVTIDSSNSLKENLPKEVFDRIDIIGSEIPVLYQNSISDIDELDELILDNDGITEIRRGAFNNVPQLRKLVITNNNGLENIRNAVFNNLNIATLDLSNNSINTVASGAFDDMPELLNVNLGNNQLRIWDSSWFAHTPLLTRVSVENNLIEEIPKRAFVNFQGEKQFGSIPLTINIVLSNNKIKKIHADAFKGLDKINSLWLDGNEIDSWDENWLTEVTLKDLRVDNNKLRCLSGDLKKIFVAATTHIDGNPWDCGCLKNIDLWASEHDKDVIRYYSKMTCDLERIDRKMKELDQLLKKTG